MQHESNFMFQALTCKQRWVTGPGSYMVLLSLFVFPQLQVWRDRNSVGWSESIVWKTTCSSINLKPSSSVYRNTTTEAESGPYFDSLMRFDDLIRICTECSRDARCRRAFLVFFLVCITVLTVEWWICDVTSSSLLQKSVQVHSWLAMPRVVTPHRFSFINSAFSPSSLVLGAAPVSDNLGLTKCSFGWVLDYSVSASCFCKINLELLFILKVNLPQTYLRGRFALFFPVFAEDICPLWPLQWYEIFSLIII